jgi:hypothetical protein
MTDPYLWALDLGPLYPGGPSLPVGAHLIVSGEVLDADGFVGEHGEVLVSACGRKYTKGSHPRGWQSTGLARLPLQDHAVHCGAGRVREGRW